MRSRRSRTSDVVVREGTPGDAAAIVDARDRSWQVAYAHVFPAEALASLDDAREEAVERWHSGMAAPRPGFHTLVAELDGGVVGLANFGPAREEAGCGELFMIYVAPEAWGRGAGQALMARTLEKLAADGYPEAILWVLEDNPRTRRFYERSGWHADGGSMEQEWLDTLVREVRYRIALAPAG